MTSAPTPYQLFPVACEGGEWEVVYENEKRQFVPVATSRPVFWSEDEAQDWIDDQILTFEEESE